MPEMGEIQLVGWGRVPAIEAADLEVGMTTLWSLGYRERIIKVTALDGGKIKLWLRSLKSGINSTRIVSDSTLVGIEEFGDE